MSICWTQNLHVLVEKIVLSAFRQIAFYAVWHRWYFSEVVAVEVSESRIRCANMFCHVLISWSCQMRCQNCGSMFFCHIAIWVLQMECRPLTFFQEGYWVIIILCQCYIFLNQIDQLRVSGSVSSYSVIHSLSLLEQLSRRLNMEDWQHNVYVWYCLFLKFCVVLWFFKENWGCS